MITGHGYKSIRNTGISLLVLICCLLTVSCQSEPVARPTTKAIDLNPVGGIYFGVNLDWGRDNALDFNQRLGFPARVFVNFFKFPFTDEDIRNLDNYMDQVIQVQAIALITLEPYEGLETINQFVADELATLLSHYNNQGVSIIVRFAHEMNGSWYPWSQQPGEYIRVFKIMAEAIYKGTTDTAMLWAPNYGGGYPFKGGAFEAKPASRDFDLLDTHRDGLLDENDDPYGPYYPGNEWVDWVGMSVYHWGNQYPWGENEIPEDNAFIAKITGTYSGLDGDQTGIPDFYGIYAKNKNKPMAIVETAALYNPAAFGNKELEVKRAWWKQVFDSQMLSEYPGIKMINWFEHRKYETEVAAEIDWTVTFNPEIAREFRSALPVKLMISKIVNN